MLSSFILSVTLLIQPSLITNSFGADEGYLHICSASATPLVMVVTSVNDIEHDEDYNIIIRDAYTTEGNRVEIITLRGENWNCSSTKATLDSFLDNTIRPFE